ncbi:MAG: S8 family peptidase [Chitinophagaceae bacterium]|nr:S8 family peptidase [Chitinophagaceae bacterium]
MKKNLLVTGIAFCLYASASFAQGTNAKTLPQGWHLLDKEKDGVYGISLQKAYDLLKGKKSNTIIVAVIDSGIDTLHEDLKRVLWVNPKETPGNGIDDDKNGYVDDVNGWNFIGGKDGSNVKEDSYEAARVYHRYKALYEGNAIDSSNWKAAEKNQYIIWQKARDNVKGSADEDGAVNLVFLKKAYDSFVKNDSILQKAIGKDVYTGKELDLFVPSDASVKAAKEPLVGFMKANKMEEMTTKEFLEGMNEYIGGQERKAESVDKGPKEYRAAIVKDNEADINDKYYGNNDVMASTPLHGTHVAGIIGADRTNGTGANGVADNVKIMSVRAVPDGDEHDKDIALAIRYAVDNGARVINMSFGKSFSPEKSWVDDAVKYAESKGVLLVHAAGNDAKNIDSAENFPNPVMLSDKKRASNWITVGASSDPLSEPGYGSLTASFSNYGKTEVDVFSPGTKIYSTLPGGNKYGNLQGTSMASPVVAGLAALIFSYYPNLTPQQVKFAIEKSAVIPPLSVKVPGSAFNSQLTDISKTGGIINAYEAIKLAGSMKGEKPPKPILKKGKKS